MTIAVEQWLAANVPLVERLARFVCRDSRLGNADADDFVSQVMLHLVEDDYAVLRKFEGRCELTSYLIVVIRRWMSDFLVRERGKYRPSREAERLGAAAVELETMLRRDGRTLDEAITALRARGHELTSAEAEQLAARLPERKPRPQQVALDEDIDPPAPPSDDELRADRATGSRAVSEALRGAIAELPAEDQTILRLHFGAGWTVADISRSLQTDQQRLYARLRKLCRTFRARLIAAGVDAAQVADLIGRGDVEFDFGLQISDVRPSSPRGSGDEESVQ